MKNWTHIIRKFFHWEKEDKQVPYEIKLSPPPYVPPITYSPPPAPYIPFKRPTYNTQHKKEPKKGDFVISGNQIGIYNGTNIDILDGKTKKVTDKTVIIDNLKNWVKENYNTKNGKLLIAELFKNERLNNVDMQKFPSAAFEKKLTIYIKATSENWESETQLPEEFIKIWKKNNISVKDSITNKAYYPKCTYTLFMNNKACVRDFLINKPYLKPFLEEIAINPDILNQIAAEKISQQF